jgi:hypothetical protein
MGGLRVQDIMIFDIMRMNEWKQPIYFAVTVFCVYCNGTGEWNQAAQAYVKNHICQCIVLDRKFCPVCNKPCHHDTSLNPKQTIDSGHGGMSMPGMTM